MALLQAFLLLLTSLVLVNVNAGILTGARVQKNRINSNHWIGMEFVSISERQPTIRPSLLKLNKKFFIAKIK
jgi:hypothetical protein